MNPAGRAVGAAVRLAVALCVLDAASAAALLALGRAGYRYEPIHDAVLTDAQRETVERIVRGDKTYLCLRPSVGWAPRPGGASGPYHATADGSRAPASSPAPGERRVLAYGDSFTHGDEVADTETWPAALDADPTFSTENFGVSG